MSHDSSDGSDSDPLSLLSRAISSSSSSSASRSTSNPDSSTLLSKLYSLLAQEPSQIPLLLPVITGIPLEKIRSNQAFKAWVIDFLDLCFNRSTLSTRDRDQLAPQIPQLLQIYLDLDFSNPNLKPQDSKFAKLALQCFASIYQALFKNICIDRSTSSKDLSSKWDIITFIKNKSLQLIDQQPDKKFLGVKTAGIRVLSRVVMVQSKVAGDPRKKAQDFSLSSVPSSHPILKVAELENEATSMLTKIVTMAFTSSITDIVTSTLSTLLTLSKLRSGNPIGEISLKSLTSWTPTALTTSEVSFMGIKNTEKTLELGLTHLLRNGLVSTEIKEEVGKCLEGCRRRVAELERKREEELIGKGKRKRREIEEEVDRRNANGVEEMKRQRNQEPQPGNQVVSNGQAAFNSNVFLEASKQGSNLQTGRTDLTGFDVSKLEVELVIDLIISSLQTCDDRSMEMAIQTSKNWLERNSNQNGENALQNQGSFEEGSREPIDPLKIDVGDEDERLDQLQSQWDPNAEAQNLEDQAGPSNSEQVEQEMETQEVSLLGIENFTLSQPTRLSERDRQEIIGESVTRLFNSRDLSLEKNRIEELKDDDDEEAGGVGKDFGLLDEHGGLWIMIVVRLATRGFGGPSLVVDDEPMASKSNGEETSNQLTPRTSNQETINRNLADGIREKLLDFIAENFVERVGVAINWLMEEWFADAGRRRSNKKKPQRTNEEQVEVEEQSSASNSSLQENYPIWLEKLIVKLIPRLDSKDKRLSQLLSDLPSVPSSVLTLVGSLCLDKSKISIGFSILRDVATNRPPSREIASEILLKLTRNKDKVIRGAAIITVRGWVSNVYLSSLGLEEPVMMFARDALVRLTLPKKSEDGDVEMEEPKKEEADQEKALEEGETEEEPEIIEDLTKPIVSDEDVLRLVELPFALSVKLPSMLDEIFQSYVLMSPVIQVSVRKHIAALIRSLGPNNAKLLHLLDSFPKGSDELALDVFNILMEKGRSENLIDLIKKMIEERSGNDLNPRFLVPILPDLNKSEILEHLPKVVTILHSRTSPEERNQDRLLIKSVFQSIVEMPDEGFGSVSTNLPRIKKDDLLTPTELMSTLHFKEKEIGIKTADEAIKICFGMTDVFRSEVLAAIINQMVDEPVLPTLFMRTVITAVSTYKSLTGYISTNILSELITKKVWQAPLVWQGFIICAAKTAPGSYGALMQLPREQLKDVIKKQPALKNGLRDHLKKKAGANTHKLQQILELLGDDEGEENKVNGIMNGNKSRSNTPASLSETNGGNTQNYQ